MSRWRRSVAAVALTCGALAGCAGPAAELNPPQDPRAGIEVWIRQAPSSPSADTADALAAAYTTKTGVPVTVVAISNDFETKLWQRAAQKDLPDVIINDTSQLGQLAVQGLVRPIDRGAYPDVSDRAWSAAQDTDGTYYGVPFSAQVPALLINRKWRERLNLPLPTTDEQLRAMASAFTRDDPDGDGKADTYGLDFAGSTTRGYASWYMTSFLWGDGGDFIGGPAGSVAGTMSTPASTAGVGEVRDMACVDRSIQPGAGTADTSVAHQSFESGQSGIYLVGPYILSRFDKSMGKDAYDVVAMPPGSAGSTVLAEGENLYLSQGSRNRAAQESFAAFASSREGQEIAMSPTTTGQIVRLPVNTTVDAQAIRKDPRWDVYAQSYATSGRYVPAVPSWTAIRQLSADTVNALIVDCSLDLRTELTELDGKLDAELKLQGERS